MLSFFLNKYAYVTSSHSALRRGGIGQAIVSLLFPSPAWLCFVLQDPHTPGVSTLSHNCCPWLVLVSHTHYRDGLASEDRPRDGTLKGLETGSRTFRVLYQGIVQKARYGFQLDESLQLAFSSLYGEENGQTRARGNQGRVPSSLGLNLFIKSLLCTGFSLEFENSSSVQKEPEKWVPWTHG